MKQILILLIFSLNASLAHAGGGFALQYSGEWQGVGVQTDGSDWGMRAEITQDQGVIEYPNLGCGGIWSYLDVAESYLTGIELIQYGLNNCIETGNIRLQPNGLDQMLFIWCGEEDGVSAIAILERNQGKVSSYQTQLTTTRGVLESLGDRIEQISCNRQKWLGV